MAKSGLTHIDVGPELTRTEWESEETHELVHGNAFPGAPVERQLFYRDDLHLWYVYDGSAWEPLQAAAAIEAHRTGEVHVLDQPPAAHDNTKHTVNYEQEGVAATQIETHRTTATHTQDQPPAAHDNAKHSTAYATEAALTTHEGLQAAPVHGSTALATAAKLVHRDASGRASVADPAADTDIDTRGGRNTAIETHRSAGVHDADQPPAAHDNAKHSTAYASEADFNNHSARHELGGADVLSVGGLSGELADDQPPKAHGNAAHSPDFAEEAAFLAHMSRHKWLEADMANIKDLIMQPPGILRILNVAAFDGLTEYLTGSASTSPIFAYWTFKTGATQNSIAMRYANATDWHRYDSESFRWRWFVRYSPRTTNLGHKTYIGTFATVSTPAAGNRICFEIDTDGKIYACCGDGVNSNRVDTGVAIAGNGVYDLYWKYMENDIKFYIGMTLRATLTTYRPTSVGLRFAIHHSNPDDAAEREAQFMAARMMAGAE